MIINNDISRSKGRHSRPVSKYGVNSSGNPDVVPAKAGNYHLEAWIPRIKYWVGLVEPGMTNRIRLTSSCVEFKGGHTH